MAVKTWSAGEVLAAADLNDTFASKLDLAGGKILQVVRATDSTRRDTTSTSFVDGNISVTITPQKSDSAVLLIWSVRVDTTGGSNTNQVGLQITDSSNNGITGANSAAFGLVNSTVRNVAQATIIAYATPATTSSVTYKGRFSTQDGTATSSLRNDNNTGQLYAIEVSA